MLNLRNLSCLKSTNLKFLACYSKKADKSLTKTDSLKLKTFVQKYLESDLKDAALETKLKPIKQIIANQVSHLTKSF